MACRHGYYQGHCSLGLLCQNLENPQLREALGMAAGMSGVLVNNVQATAPAAQVSAVAAPAAEGLQLPYSHPGAAWQLLRAALRLPCWYPAVVCRCSAGTSNRYSGGISYWWSAGTFYWYFEGSVSPVQAVSDQLRGRCPSDGPPSADGHNRFAGSRAVSSTAPLTSLAASQPASQPRQAPAVSPAPYPSP